MNPLTLLTDAKSSLDAAVDIIKIYKGVQDTINKIELESNMIELKSNILDAKDNILELRSALADKDEEIAKLKSELKLRKELKYEAPVYWHYSEDDTKDGPFCQKCYDSDNKIIRLQIHCTEHDGAWDCNVCNSHYRTKEYDKYMNSMFEEAANMAHSF